jgi:hypothetical protein
MWRSEILSETLYRALTHVENNVVEKTDVVDEANVVEELRQNCLLNKDDIFESIVEAFTGELEDKKEFETICSRWRGTEGQINGIRRHLREAKEQTTHDFESLKKLARKIDIKSKFLFRGVKFTTEYAEVEDLTATSLSVSAALDYGTRPFMVIYVPTQEVYGIPISCEESGFGNNSDNEVLLIQPSIKELNEDHVDKIKDVVLQHLDTIPIAKMMGLNGYLKSGNLKLYEYAA